MFDRYYSIKSCFHLKTLEKRFKKLIFATIMAHKSMKDS